SNPPAEESDTLAVAASLTSLTEDWISSPRDTTAYPPMLGRLLPGYAGAARDSITALVVRAALDADGAVGAADSLAVLAVVRGLEREAAIRRGEPFPHVDGFARILFDDTVDVHDLLQEVRAIDEVERAVIAAPPAPTPPSGSQGYLDPGAQGGVDARHVWPIAGGRGSWSVTDAARAVDDSIRVAAYDSVRIGVCDVSFWEDHPELPKIVVLGELPPDSLVAVDYIRHGTRTLGVLVAQHEDNAGIKGICPDARIYFSTTWNPAAVARTPSGWQGTSLDEPAARVRMALDRFFLNESSLVDVLLIESSLAADTPTLQGEELGGGCCARSRQALPSRLPVEAHLDVRGAISTLTLWGTVVVEPAGNGRRRLVKVVDAFDKVVWDPATDSGAIMVGGGRKGSSSTAHERWPESNYGARVDCQGWGEAVMTTTYAPSLANAANLSAAITDAGSDLLYTSDFNGTSSASAIIAGVVAVYQSVQRAKPEGSFMFPDWVRSLLRDENNGSKQPEPDKTSFPIGPLPDLLKLLDDDQLDDGQLEDDAPRT
ncbi:MAG: S8 family serine peptidase, partial [Candidatus Eiseniibacteriota bacterium]